MVDIHWTFFKLYFHGSGHGLISALRPRMALWYEEPWTIKYLMLSIFKTHTHREPDRVLGARCCFKTLLKRGKRRSQLWTRGAAWTKPAFSAAPYYRYKVWQQAAVALKYFPLWTLWSGAYCGAGLMPASGFLLLHEEGRERQALDAFKCPTSSETFPS